MLLSNKALCVLGFIEGGELHPVRSPSRLMKSPPIFWTMALTGTEWTLWGLISFRHSGVRTMNIFYIIGVVVVVLFVLGYFGFR